MKSQPSCSRPALRWSHVNISIRAIIFQIFLTTLLLFSLPSFLSAQADQGSVSGQVKDTSGAVIPNAKVTLEAVDTGFKSDQTSDGNGNFTFSPVRIGSYRLLASAPGFQNISQQNITVNVQSRLSVPLVLQVGESTQTVDVTSAPPLLQTEESSTGQVVTSQAINNTPLNGRNWVYIAQLSSGVTSSNGSRGQGTGDFSANGQSAQQNNFILDGVDNNTNVVDLLNGASYGVRPPPDALAEFRLQTGSYNAEFGHSAGAVVNASLKSGTNEVHGSAWEYFRNDFLNAHSWGTEGEQKYRQNQFGATLGLPIIKNKLFIFGDFEANRIIFGQPGTYTVPTALMRQGNFSELLNTNLTGNPQANPIYQPGSGGTVAQSCNGQANVLCPSQINPVAQNILNLYPLPNSNGGATFNNYRVNRNTRDNIFQFDTRVDYNISANDQAFIRYSNGNEPVFRPSPLGQTLDGGTFGDSGNSRLVNQSGAFSETHVFTPTLSNEFRLGFNYGHYSFLQANANQNIAAQLGLGGIPFQALQGGLPNVAVGGITSFGSPGYYPSNEYQNNLQILDNVSKIFGRHSLRVGVNFQRINFYTLQPPAARGTYNYNGQYTGIPGQQFTGSGVADFLTNQMQNATITNVSSTNNERWVRAGYVQDDWKATSRLTLNLGVRYEYQAPISEWYDRQALFYPTVLPTPGGGRGLYILPESQRGTALPQSFTNALAQNNLDLQYSSNPALIRAQRNNFAPRVGLAFQADSKTVIRAGYGIFFGGIASLGYSNNLAQNFPFNFQSNFPAPTCSGGVGNCSPNGLTLENGFSAQLANGLANSVQTPGLTGADARIRTPYTQSFNLTVERSITTNMAASVSYIGALGRHLVAPTDPNAPAGITTANTNTQFLRPFPNFGGSNYNSYNGISNYHSFQAKIEKRFSQGLYFLATYTWAHALDNIRPTLDADGGYRNPNIFPAGEEYSNSAFDVRQRLTINGNYELPFGKGKTFFSGANGLMQRVVGGWSTSMTFQAQTGNPFSVGPNNVGAAGAGTRFAPFASDPFTAGGSAPASNPGVTCAAQTRTPQNWYNPCAFGNPLSGGSIPVGTVITDPGQAAPYFGGIRNSVYGPGYARVNFSLFKNFSFLERVNLQLRADVFNLANTPAYGQPAVTNNNSTGGQITNTRFFQNYTPDARFFQVAAKIIF